MQNNQNKLFWLDETRARIFNKHIQKHILSLSAAYLIGGVPKTFWVSGFLVQTKNLLVWMTAGHVLKNMDQLLQRNGVGGIKTRWIDNCPKKDAQSIPCDYLSLHRIPVDIEGYDFGIVILPPFYAAQILKIKENVPLSESYWAIADGFEAEGYYLVGLPKEFTDLKQVSNGPERCEYSSFGTIVSLPVTREDSTVHQSENDFWKYPNNFYGKIVPVKNDDGALLTDISGMSGGPIFGVRNIDEEKFQYRVIALQSSWLPQSMFIRGTLFDKAIGILNQAIDLAISSNRG